MSLKDLTNALNAIAAKQPAVGTVIENDVFRLNGIPDAKYGVFAWTQGRHRVDLLSGLQTLNFYLYYVDRVDTADKSEIDAQSTGIDVLTNIVRAVVNKFDLDLSGDLVFQPFIQEKAVAGKGFKDDCAGVYVEVGFMTDAYEGCEDEFDN